MTRLTFALGALSAVCLLPACAKDDDGGGSGPAFFSREGLVGTWELTRRSTEVQTDSADVTIDVTLLTIDSSEATYAFLDAGTYATAGDVYAVYQSDVGTADARTVERTEDYGSEGSFTVDGRSLVLDELDRAFPENENLIPYEVVDFAEGELLVLAADYAKVDSSLGYRVGWVTRDTVWLGR